MKSKRRWISTLKTKDGEETFESTALVSAIGQLNDPSPARFKGEEDFKGQILHSALWSDDIKLDGKHVAVIGTGATAMQLVPSIADRVASLTVYQRTAQWARPVAGLFRSRSPKARNGCSRICRFMCSGIASTCSGAMATGCCHSCARTRPGRIPSAPSTRATTGIAQELTDFILSELKDRPDLIEKCVPTYPPYGKRILLDNDWFKTLTKPNVELVTDADRPLCARRHRHGRRQVARRRHHRDLDRLQGHGDGGTAEHHRARRQEPRERPGPTTIRPPISVSRCLISRTCSCMLGPNSGPAHGGSVIFQSECQSRYISACSRRDDRARHRRHRRSP